MINEYFSYIRNTLMGSIKFIYFSEKNNELHEGIVLRAVNGRSLVMNGSKML